MLKELKISVYKASLDLVKHNLVIFTWGNVSCIERQKGLIVIKPSGISYDEMKPENMVIVDLNGKVIEGHLKPSSDTNTHIILYRNFKGIGGIVHTHSEWATSWAQAGMGIPCLGTTHADYFYGEIPCTRKLTKEEIEGNYETETANVIVDTFKNKNPNEIPGVLVHSHGPFVWGADANDAVHNAVVMEEIAKIAHNTYLLKKVPPVDQYLINKHYQRKHGKDAYYGQT